MFIGWENGPALAEDCRDPRRSIPKALYISIAIATALFVLFAYATVTGFHYKVTSIGRSGLLPAALGRVRATDKTPVNALLAMAGAGLTIIAVWWAAHIVGLDHGSTNPVGLYAECSTMGTIVILFVYLLSAVSLPVFMWRQRRASFSAARHLVVPLLGAAALILPFIELCKPGQPAPYSYFPYIALGLRSRGSRRGAHRRQPPSHRRRG